MRAGLGGVVLAAGLAFGASGADFHQVFEERCTSCHGHAGEFVRGALTERDGILESQRTGRAVADFLTGHAGGLDSDEVALFIEVFTAQLRSAGFYRERCHICHGRARDFARLRLIVSEGQLTGRYSGRDIEAFLPGHARMSGDEARRMLEALTGILAGAR